MYETRCDRQRDIMGALGPSPEVCPLRQVRPIIHTTYSCVMVEADDGNSPSQNRRPCSHSHYPFQCTFAEQLSKTNGLVKTRI